MLGQEHVDNRKKCVQQLRGTRRVGAVFDYFFCIQFMRWEWQGQGMEWLFICIVHFALMQNEPKNQDLF
ncbi:hypothetical protein EC396_11215 [Lutibacter sp. HS1-25]|nr:hypothetical protein EC396_11215 [Lutibacter sp. HS1-25]